MTARNYLRVLRERWRLITVIVLLSIGVAALVTAGTPKVYQATAQVFVSSNASSDPIAQYQAAAFAQSQVATYAQIVDSPDVLQTVKSDLHLSLTASQLRGKISADAPASTTLVLVHATDGHPNTAASIANSAARAFVTQIERYSTPSNSSTPGVKLFVTDPAFAPSAPVSPNAVLNVILGLFVGLFVGAALAVTRDVLDNRIRNVDDFAEATRAPVMGVIIEDPNTTRHPIATRAGPRSIRAENFRQLRANLQFANVDRHPRVIAVTSSIPAEGKTMVALNLASTLAEAGFTVCLVDADLRRPTVAKTLGLPGVVGLTSVLIQQIDLDDALQSAGSNLFVLTSGPTPPNPSEVLASSYAREIIHSLLERVDYVVLDTAPLLPVADGSEVAALADGTLLVGRYKYTTEAQVKRATASLSRVDANLIGVMLNRVPNNRSGEYGYSYYTREPATKRGQSEKRPEGRRLLGKKADVSN